jgi:hypothetical protein
LIERLTAVRGSAHGPCACCASAGSAGPTCDRSEISRSASPSRVWI